MNLGWKSAQVVKGTSPESLLDTYHAGGIPLRPACCAHTTMAQVALQRTDDRTEPCVSSYWSSLGMEEPRKRIAAEMSGLGIHYNLGEGHPLLGRRVPDLDLATANGPLRVYSLLHSARPAFINLGEHSAFDITPWADRVQLINANYSGTWNFPAIGAVTAPSAVLVRPDGYAGRQRGGAILSRGRSTTRSTIRTISERSLTKGRLELRKTSSRMRRAVREAQE
jgi:aromatic ring hydroxylase-like protein